MKLRKFLKQHNHCDINIGFDDVCHKDGYQISIPQMEYDEDIEFLKKVSTRHESIVC